MTNIAYVKYIFFIKIHLFQFPKSFFFQSYLDAICSNSQSLKETEIKSPKQPDGKLAIENIPLACQIDKKKRSKSLKQPTTKSFKQPITEYTVETILAKKFLKGKSFFKLNGLATKKLLGNQESILIKQPGTLISIPKGQLVPGYSTSQSRTCEEVIIKI